MTTLAVVLYAGEKGMHKEKEKKMLGEIEIDTFLRGETKGFSGHFSSVAEE